MTGHPNELRPREHAIDGLVNFRDLGGLPTRDGRMVRPGRVFRSDNPKSLTPEGKKQLVSVVAPALVIDLRIPLEVTREGYDLGDDVTLINCPMTPQSGINQEQIDAGMCDNLVDDYMRQIEVNGGFVAQALSLIADPVNLPVVIHCTAGKDRTGIVAAMLLELLGVPHEDIVHDYQMTTRNMAPVVERIRSAPVFQENGLAYAPDWIFASDAQTMEGFLARMTAEFDSAEQWALQQGLTQAQVDRLRSELLSD